MYRTDSSTLKEYKLVLSCLVRACVRTEKAVEALLEGSPVPDLRRGHGRGANRYGY